MEALHAAVTLAKNEQIRSVRVLRSRLERMGFTADEVTEALTTWGNYVKSTRADQRP